MLNIIFYSLKLSGVVTIRIHFTWMKEAEKWKLSLSPFKTNISYNLFLILLLMAMHVFTYNYAISSHFGGRFDKDTAIIAILDSLVVMTAVLILGIYCIKQKKIIIIANKMSKAKNFTNFPICFKNNQILLLCVGNISTFLLSIFSALQSESRSRTRSTRLLSDVHYLP